MNNEIKLKYDPVVTIAVADTCKSVSWENEQYKLSALYEKFSHCTRTSETQTEFLKLKGGSKADKDRATEIKDVVGGFVGGELDGTGRRQRENVVNRQLLTLDIDSGIRPFDLGSGISCARYTTHSHTTEHPRFRIIAPLSRPTTAEEYERLSRLYVLDIADMLGVDPAEVFTDDTTHLPEHMMFWASASKDGLFEFDYQDGNPIDVDAVLDTDREGFYYKSTSAAAPGVKLGPGEKVKVGSRYKHLISRARTLVNKMHREFSDDAILAALWQVAHDECEGDIDGEDFNAFCDVYRGAVAKFRAIAEGDDLNYSDAVRKYFELNPGETELPRKAGGKTDWDKVREVAGNLSTDESDGEPGQDARPEQNPQEPTEDKKVQLIPESWSDLDQARIFAKLFGNRVKYAKGFDWLVYSDGCWKADEHEAMRCMQILTDGQLREAKARIAKAEGDGELKAAQELLKTVLGRRNDKKLSAGLSQAIPMLKIKTEDLDKDPFLLNTPSGTIDLRTGTLKPHDPNDYLMKMTGCSPSEEGAEEFDRFLTEITSYDNELKSYLQMVSGMCLIGEVFRETLMIAYGTGGNGKSTFFNLLSYVMGSYAGTLPAELFVGNQNNKGAELAELKGKRFVIAAELQEGARLDTGTVKNLCSTDPIHAARKYKDPFEFIPSHHCVLYTNNLPRVVATDTGTWDRLTVIPFTGRFRNTQKEIPNYAAVLYEKVGGACLQWMIAGAKMFIDSGYKLTPPKCVSDAIADYADANDWISDFVSNYCEMKIDYTERASDMYTAYQQYCYSIGERPRTRAVLTSALERVGIVHFKNNRGKFYSGARLKAEVAEKIRAAEQ